MVVEKRKDAVCVAPSPKLKATYARTDISHPDPCDPNSLFHLINMIESYLSLSGWRYEPVQPCLGVYGNVVPLHYTSPLMVM